MKRSSDQDAEVIRNILENEDEEYQPNLGNENVEGPSAPKKKKRYSPIWKHFTLKLMDDDKTEFAHCNYCTK